MPKAKKSGTEGLAGQLKLVMKSGKSKLGYKECLKTLRTGKAKLVLIICPILKKILETFALLPT